jgi:hypothetical protein
MSYLAAPHVRARGLCPACMLRVYEVSYLVVAYVDFHTAP